MRLAGKQPIVGYWDVPAGQSKLVREPLGVLGWDQIIRCNYPETGD